MAICKHDSYGIPTHHIQPIGHTPSLPRHVLTLTLACLHSLPMLSAREPYSTVLWGPRGFYRQWMTARVSTPRKLVRSMVPDIQLIGGYAGLFLLMETRVPFQIYLSFLVRPILNTIRLASFVVVKFAWSEPTKSRLYLASETKDARIYWHG
jgi:hypothetical protein